MEMKTKLDTSENEKIVIYSDILKYLNETPAKVYDAEKIKSVKFFGKALSFEHQKELSSC